MKKLCIIHANCQGEALAAQLAAHAEFGAEHDVRLVSNFRREPVPEELLARCGLFLYQHLGPEWGELASERILARLPRACPALCVPNMFLLGPWPLWMSGAGFNYHDRLLEELAGRGLGRAEALRVCLRADLPAMYDLHGLVARSFEHEQAKQARTPVRYLDRVLAAWRGRRLFHTVNHPGPELQRLAADAVLDFAGQRPLSDAEFAAAGPRLAEFDLPVHPRAAEALGLAYGKADEMYEVYGRRMSFAEYAGHYVSCRLLGEADFIGYLRLAAAGQLPEPLRHAAASAE